MRNVFIYCNFMGFVTSFSSYNVFPIVNNKKVTKTGYKWAPFMINVNKFAKFDFSMEIQIKVFFIYSELC